MTVPTATGVRTTRPVSTQDSFGKILVDLSRDERLAPYLVTTAPDVATSTNLAGWIGKVGVWQKSGDYKLADFRSRAGDGWHHSTWDERIPIQSLYDNVVHWQLMLQELDVPAERRLRNAEMPGGVGQGLVAHGRSKPVQSLPGVRTGQCPGDRGWKGSGLISGAQG